MDYEDKRMLEEHLQYNFIPPVHPSWIEKCIEAIEAYKNADPDLIIVDYGNGERETALDIIEDLRLDYWIEQ